MHVRAWTVACSVASAASLLCGAALAQMAPPAPVPSPDLEARVARLEARAEAKDAGNVVQEPLPITVSGFVQIDWNVTRQSSQDEVTQDGKPLNDDRFLLRRARIRGERDFGYLHGVVEIDTNTVDGVQVRPTDVEATFKWPATRPYSRTPWAYDPTGSRPRLSMKQRPPPYVDDGQPWFRVSAGLLRTPFGVEVPEWDYDRPWLERSSLGNALFPGTVDLGAGIFGGFRFVRYALAIMNGDPLGEKTFPGRDPNKSKDLVFRVGGANEVVPGLVVEGGLSGLTGRGFHKGNPATVDTIQWQDSNNNGLVDDLTELHIIPGSPATPSASFKRFAVGGDLRVAVTLPVLGDLQVRGEIVRASNLDRGTFVSDPVAANRDLRQLGWFVGVAQDLTPWAQIAVRYDRYDPDSDAREQEPFAVVPRDLAMASWAFTATARAWIVRFMAEYDHRDNALGRDVSGRPTTLADDAFTLRAEMRF